jgi:hypothetical protein
MTKLEVTKLYTRADRDASIYQYVPFEVPAGTAGITIEMRHHSPTAVIDLGLFDSYGFRGASGSERDIVMVSANKATPGYLPGEIKPGTWFVFIGLHRVDAEGTAVEVKVSLGKPNFPADPPQPAKPQRPPRRILHSESGRRWFAADFHSHSVHSDGALTLDELAALAASRGLEILTVSDHNTTSHHPHLAASAKFAGINLLAGQEVTTDSGHANSFGMHEWIDFREATDSWLRETTERGGLLAVNHPIASPCHWSRDLPDGIPLTELWHSSWDRRSYDPIAWWEANGRAIPIGGSDFHRVKSDGLPGEPTTWVQIDTEDNEVTQNQILEALSNGRVAISANPAAPVVYPHEDRVLIDGGEGCTLITPSGVKHQIRKTLEDFSAEPGLYLLTDNSDTYQALGYIGGN